MNEQLPLAIDGDLHTPPKIREPLPALPTGWSWARLAEIALIQGGLTKGKKRKPSDRLREVPYLRVANVQRGFLDLDDVLNISATDDEIAALRLQPGDVLFNEGGDRDKLGRGWVWRGELPLCIHQNHVFRARLTDTAAISPKLMSWYGNSAGQRYFWDEGKHTTNLASINLTKLGNFPVPVPPSREQRAIVECLETQFSRLDAAVEGLKRVQANLKRYRASVLKAAVEGRLVPTEAELAKQESRDYEPASVLLERLLKERRHRWEQAELAKLKASGKTPKDDKWKSRYEEPAAPDTSALSELPEGWCWATLAQLAEVQGGIQKGKNRSGDAPLREVPYLRVANVQRGYLDLAEVKRIHATNEEIEALALQPGDVLFNEGGDRDKLGRGWIWRGEIDLCIHQNHVFRARPVSCELRSKFISWYGNSAGQRYFFDEGKQTTNLASLNSTKLRALPVPLPPIDEQIRIERELERLLSEADAINASVANDQQRCARLRQSIIKWAFEGKLVDQDPNDEPASVLLERIRAERAAASTASGPAAVKRSNGRPRAAGNGHAGSKRATMPSRRPDREEAKP